MFRSLFLSSAFVASVLGMAAVAVAAPNHEAGDTMRHTSAMFQGVKANTGRVTHTVRDGQDHLTLSDDFQTPDAPAPHWQVVDSQGNVYLLQRLMIKDSMGKMTGDKPAQKLNRSIVVPTYIRDVVKVQIWCAFAETLLGETTFESVIPLSATSDSMSAMHMSSKFMGIKANTGSVTHLYVNGRSTLTLSEDFKAPDAPAPHWQIVDSAGNVYLLQSLNTKGEKMNRSIQVPAYVPDVRKVQMWCAWAEVLLGEAEFETPVR